MLDSLKPYRWLLIIAVAIVIVDQVTKAVMMATLPEGTLAVGAHGNQVDPITVIPGFFYLVHVTNDGAAFSILEGRAFWLGLLGVAALVAMGFFRKKLELHRFPHQWIFGLIAGGIFGNVIDRFRFGHVVDFLDFHFGSYRYPAFNVADSAITVGVICFLVYTWFFEGPERKQKPAPASSEKPS